jgi:hypothetical protein
MGLAAGLLLRSRYLLAEGGIVDWICASFYLDNPDKNLQNILWPTGVYWGDNDDVRPYKPSYNYQV